MVLSLRCLVPLAAAILLTACAGEQDESKGTPRPALTITAAHPVTETWAVRIPANGTVEAWQ